MNVLILLGCASLFGTDIAPEIEMTVPSKGYADIEVVLSATAIDNHDLPSELLINWTSDIDGELPFSAPNDEGGFSFTGLMSTGNHILSLSAEDLDGNRTSISQEFLMGPANTAPSCSFVSTDEYFSVDSTFRLEAQASDPDISSENLLVEWYSDADGFLGVGDINSEGLITIELSALSWYDHLITVVVTDEVGGTCESSGVVRIGQIPNIEYCSEVSGWSAEWEAFEEEVLVRTNQIREQGTTCGDTSYPPAPPLTMQRNLRCAARVHSKDMFDRDYFAHTNPSGEDPGERISSAEYPWNSYGENIAYRYATPQEVVQGWHDSPGHCSNMMSDWFDELGVGIYDGGTGLYWTQNFGSR